MLIVIANAGVSVGKIISAKREGERGIDGR
jgi:hypothetical protein